jgi:hypothetical protein
MSGCIIERKLIIETGENVDFTIFRGSMKQRFLHDTVLLTG